MVNPISGLPPTLLSNFVQEVSPGQIAKNISGEESAAQTDKSTSVMASDEKNQQKSNTTTAEEQKVIKEEDKNKNADYSKLAEIVKNSLGSENVTIEFTRDKEADMMVMQVIDSKTKEIIKQFPPDITLKIAKIVAKLLETTGQVTNAQV
jgi:uncharacterized FlaG/YvyC family protein